MDDSDQQIATGDILEPIVESASVPVGLYQVTEIEGADILLTRLHANEDGKLSKAGRVSWIARSELGLFRKLHVSDDRVP
jgi:hypothetical protein